MGRKAAATLFRLYGMVGLLLVGLSWAPPTWADAGKHPGAPLQAKALGDPDTLAAGDDHTCTITESGTVKYWGYNFYGQLGDGSTTSSTTPVTVAAFPEYVRVFLWIRRRWTNRSGSGPAGVGLMIRVLFRPAI